MKRVPPLVRELDPTNQRRSGAAKYFLKRGGSENQRSKLGIVGRVLPYLRHLTRLGFNLVRLRPVCGKRYHYMQGFPLHSGLWDFGVVLQDWGMGTHLSWEEAPLIPAGVLCSIHLFREGVLHISGKVEVLV